ncbi:MAG TPA: hypothetical protein VKF39_00860 [Nitrososphaerales archaeon]|nr:hypothetical protein [Nitrososphaerales archaeon]
MRPVLGVLIELTALGAVALTGILIPGGLPHLLYVAVAELIATYLIHCPAHYFVGRVLGIGFVSMGLGMTTLAKALPPQLSRFAHFLPVFTLKTDRPSLSKAGRRRASAMYASGTVASVLSAFLVAAWITPSASLNLLIVAWVIAFGYLAFDMVFSPRSGDLMRTRKAMGASGPEPVGAQK